MDQFVFVYVCVLHDGIYRPDIVCRITQCNTENYVQMKYIR